MWFEETSWSNLHVGDLVEEWRDLWPYKADFMIVAMSYLFAMTNWLNLPKLILDNGGVAFVAAYGVSLLLCVLPTLVLEMAVGQITGRAPVLAFYNLFPVFKGIGVAQVLFTIVVLVVMTKFVAWLGLYMYYLGWTIHSARTGLPWLNCKNFPEFLSFPCKEAGSLSNSTDGSLSRLNVIQPDSSLQQFMTTIERPLESITEFGEFQIPLLIAQGVVWASVFVAICFGVRMLGKYSSILFFIAFSLSVGLLVRAVTMGGFLTALELYWQVTDWNKLLDYQVWRLAIEQSILGCGIGFGAFITLSSYNKRHNNLVGSAFLLLLWHAIITTIQVTTVIGLVGFVAHQTGLTPHQLLDKGESQMWHLLAYLSYIPSSTIWTGLILIVSIAILLNLFFVLSLSVLSTLEDALGEAWSKCFPRFVLALFVSGLCYGLSLYFATQAGRHSYELASGFMKYITIYVILAFELFATSWLYCAHKLGNDLHAMLRNRCCSCFGHFLLYFTYLLPVVPGAIAVLNAMDYNYSVFSEPVRSWEWSEYVGAAVALVPLVPIPLYFIFTVLCACCCKTSSEQQQTKGKRVRSTFSSKLQRPVKSDKLPNVPRYTHNAPGYHQLPQAPLAEPEIYA